MRSCRVLYTVRRTLNTLEHAGIITRFCVAGYRSLRDVRLPLDHLTVVTGPNGSGKSSLYRALRLIADVAQGNIIGALAGEGGLGSTLWAGPEQLSRAMLRGTQPVQGGPRSGPVGLKLGFAGEDYGYAIDLGPPSIRGSAFVRDPEIKAESLWTGERLSPRTVIAARNGPLVRLRDAAGAWRQAVTALASYDGMMTHAVDPQDGAEILVMRERLRDWRFYDQFRTDREAPARRAQVGTRTPVLAGDGADVAAAVQTILEIGDRDAFADTISDAFAGGGIGVSIADGVFVLQMHQPGLLRPLDAAELSDGTLRYILLATALLSPRPPSLMVLNEPETSLHPDLIAPLGRLIVRAAERSQILVVTHATRLVDALERVPGCLRIALDKRLGETVTPDVEAPRWTWLAR